ncbi:MAG TPA: aldose epimerase family protein [Salinimicrobium sp.]|nr:aldose epimerase family protein [Salinimicrobium sp.]
MDKLMNEPTPKDLKLYTLKNSGNTRLSILNYGAAIFSLKMKNKNGESTNVIVAPKTPEDFLKPSYRTHNKCFGASVGRYAGRISGGSFTLNGNTYQLFEKNGVHLHGGKEGFQYKIWKLEELREGENSSISLSYFSKDGEEGYPGNLKVTVTYTLTEKNELVIEYVAETDKETIINLTNHAYFNLNGGGDIADHILQINSEKILETDNKQLPTGNFIDLDSHPKNFQQKSKVGKMNLDETYVLFSEVKEAASLYSPESGIKMQLKTNQPAVVAYAPETLPGDWDYQTNISKKNPSICLETENFSDAPNHSHFPSSILKPGAVYRNRSVFSFTVSMEP